MTPDEVASLLRMRAGRGCEQTSHCPDEDQIAAYVDAGLAPGARASLEAHLADCIACLALVGLLSRERATGSLEAVPDELLAQARSLVPSRARRRFSTTPPWVVAASIVVAFSALVFSSHHTAPRVDLQGSDDARATRAVPSMTVVVEILHPRPGSTVDPLRPVFRWTAVAGSQFYEVRVVTSSGELLSEQRVSGTEWRPVGSLDLQPGSEYFVHVDAFPSDSTSVGSGHVPFMVSD